MHGSGDGLEEWEHAETLLKLPLNNELLSHPLHKVRGPNGTSWTSHLCLSITARTFSTVHNGWRIPTSELKQLFNPSGQVIHQVVLVLPSPHTCAGVVRIITGNLSFEANWFWSHKRVTVLQNKSEKQNKGVCLI